MMVTTPEVVASYDAVVIGAGIIGCAVALHLARVNYHVLVVDAGATAGAGSTGASSAIIRFHYRNRDSVAAAWESYQHWIRWDAYLGVRDPAGSAAFIPTGALVLSPSLQHHSALLRSFDDMGVPYELLKADDIVARYPAIDPHSYGPPVAITDEAFSAEAHGLLEGYLTPDAGYIDDPQLAAHNIMVAAQSRGAQFAFRTTVCEVIRAGGRVALVTLSDGRTIPARVVINAAGPASDGLNQLADVTGDMQVRSRPLRVETHVLPAPPHFTPDDGEVFVTDLDLGTAFRFGGGEPVAEGDGERVDGGFPSHCPSGSADPGRVQGPGDQVEAFSAACSVGKWPRALTARRYRALSDSMALVLHSTVREGVTGIVEFR